MSKALKPCPFCGGKPEHQKKNNVWSEHFECACGCDFVGNKTKWNTRVDPTHEQIIDDPRVADLVEALEKIRRETMRCRGDQSYRDACKMALSTSSTALAQLKEHKP